MEPERPDDPRIEVPQEPAGANGAENGGAITGLLGTARTAGWTSGAIRSAVLVWRRQKPRHPSVDHHSDLPPTMAKTGAGSSARSGAATAALSASLICRRHA